MKNQKSLTSGSTLKTSTQSMPIHKNRSSNSSAIQGSSNSEVTNKSQSSTASIVSNQTIDAMINSLKKYNQQSNFKSNDSKADVKSSSLSDQIPNFKRTQSKSSLFKTSITSNKVHFTSSASNTTIKSSEMDSLADSLFNNILSISSLSNDTTSLSTANRSSAKLSLDIPSPQKNSFKGSLSSNSSSVTNSGILSEFTSAENSLNHSDGNINTSQRSTTLHIAKSAVMKGKKNASLNFSTINNKKGNHANHHEYRHQDNHQVAKRVHNRPRQGLHEYQRTINAHYSRHILLILIIVTICCSFAGIIGYAATLV